MLCTLRCPAASPVRVPTPRSGTTAVPRYHALTDAAAGGGAHAGEDDHVQLLALERIHSLDEHLRGQGHMYKINKGHESQWTPAWTMAEVERRRTCSALQACWSAHPRTPQGPHTCLRRRPLAAHVLEHLAKQVALLLVRRDHTHCINKMSSDGWEGGRCQGTDVLVKKETWSTLGNAATEPRQPPDGQARALLPHPWWGL